MAQWVMLIIAKTDSLSLSPGTLRVERSNSHKLFYDLHVWLMIRLCIHFTPQSINNYNEIKYITKKK